MAERLINAAALVKDIEENCCANCDNCGGILCSCCKIDDVFCVIEDAPTAATSFTTEELMEMSKTAHHDPVGERGDRPIEMKPVVHAHWEHKEWQGKVCSACGKEAIEGRYEYQILSDYCPWCGAQMDEFAGDINVGIKKVICGATNLPCSECMPCCENKKESD